MKDEILSEQVGGNHYKGKAVQPVELYSAIGVGKEAFATNIVKYISRHRDKNGLEDVKKARHYVEFLLSELVGNLKSDLTTWKYIKVNKIPHLEADIILGTVNAMKIGGHGGVDILNSFVIPKIEELEKNYVE